MIPGGIEVNQFTEICLILEDKFLRRSVPDTNMTQIYIALSDWLYFCTITFQPGEKYVKQVNIPSICLRV